MTDSIPEFMPLRADARSYLCKRLEQWQQLDGTFLPASFVCALVECLQSAAGAGYTFFTILGACEREVVKVSLNRGQQGQGRINAGLDYRRAYGCEKRCWAEGTEIIAGAEQVMFPLPPKPAAAKPAGSCPQCIIEGGDKPGLNTEADNVPYLPGRGLYPPICRGKYAFLNDAQPPLWVEATQSWRLFALVNDDAKFKYKTRDKNTFIDGGSSWGCWLADKDFKNITWHGYVLNKGKQNDAAQTELPTIATGSVLNFNDKLYYYASTGRDLAEVSLWIADNSDAEPRYQGVVLRGADPFRDPRVRPDPTEAGKLLMVIASAGGFSFYRSRDGVKWDYVSTFETGMSGLTECPAAYFGTDAIYGAECVVFGGNQWDKGDKAPTSYYSTGRWDGTNWIECHRGKLDYANAFYGAVPFRRPVDGQWFCISWLNQWSIAANSGRPKFQGTMQIVALAATGSACVYELTTKPRWAADDFAISNYMDNIDGNGDFTELPFHQIGRGSLIRRFWDNVPNSGTEISFGARDGQHNFNADGSAAFGYHPLGVVLRKVAGGWSLTCRDYGVKPYWDLQAYDADYFIPDMEGSQCDMWFWADGAGLIVWVGSGQGAWRQAALYVNWPQGALDYREHYNISYNADGEETGREHYTGNIALYCDDYPAPLSGSGLDYRNAVGMFLDAATPIIVSENTDSSYEQRIKKLSWRPDIACAGLRRRLGDLLDKSINLPGIAPDVPKFGNGGALTTQAATGSIDPVRIIAVDKPPAPAPNGGGGAYSGAAVAADITKFARPWAETDSGQKYYLITAEQLSDATGDINEKISALSTQIEGLKSDVASIKAGLPTQIADAVKSYFEAHKEELKGPKGDSGASVVSVERA